jgi:hypothetical protein
MIISCSYFMYALRIKLKLLWDFNLKIGRKDNFRATIWYYSVRIKIMQLNSKLRHIRYLSKTCNTQINFNAFGWAEIKIIAPSNLEFNLLRSRWDGKKFWIELQKLKNSYKKQNRFMHDTNISYVADRILNSYVGLNGFADMKKAPKLCTISGSYCMDCRHAPAWWRPTEHGPSLCRLSHVERDLH